MIKKLIDQIFAGEEIRQSLSLLRKEIKEKDQLEECLVLIKGNEEKVIALLSNEDAKTRKNAALLMGDLGEQCFLQNLCEAYEKESQLFIKSAYLTAVKNMDYRDYLELFKNRLEVLLKEESSKESEKHISEEIRELTSLITMIEGVEKHPYTGYDKECDVILLTNRNFPSLAEADLKKYCPKAQTKLFGAGVMAHVPDLYWRIKSRLYQEILFVLPKLKTCEMNPQLAAKAVVDSNLIGFLNERHEGGTPYYFRTEVKSKMRLDEKTAFIKKFVLQVEKQTSRQLINSTSDYEIEIRLIENKEGRFNVLLKLYTLKDERFSYRKEAIPTGIRPYNAVLTAELARKYMKEGANVLDPFCGTGTMLIERHKVVRAGSSYGVDTFKEAIEKAKENTAEAGQLIHYINKDFFEFEHEYLFDEIITDMPFQLGKKEDREIRTTYKYFFDCAKEHLQPGGIVIMYVRDRNYVETFAPERGYRIEEKFEISKMEGTYVFVLRFVI